MCVQHQTRAYKTRNRHKNGLYLEHGFVCVGASVALGENDQDQTRRGAEHASLPSHLSAIGHRDWRIPWPLWTRGDSAVSCSAVHRRVLGCGQKSSRFKSQLRCPRDAGAAGSFRELRCACPGAGTHTPKGGQIASTEGCRKRAASPASSTPQLGRSHL